MNFRKDQFYHLYNRGNNRQKIFYARNNYLFFLEKLRLFLSPFCKIVAYCLMPNHYHVMFYTGMVETIDKLNKEVNFKSTVLSRKIGTLQSSYAQAINIQENKTGSLFQQKAKAKILEGDDVLLICLNYIHQNPWAAGLVQNMEDWEFSSYGIYVGLKTNDMINKKIVFQFIGIPESPVKFRELSLEMINKDKMDQIFI